MSEPEVQVTRFQIDFNYWINKLSVSLYNRLGMLRVLLSTIDDGSYFTRIGPRPQEGVMAAVLADIYEPSMLTKIARRETVLAMARSVIEFINTIIALKRMSTFELTRPTETVADVWEQLVESVDAESYKVDIDKNLTIPRKRDLFPYLDEDIKRSFDAMFAIRHGLEHHRAIAKEDIYLSSRGIDLVVNNTLIVEELGFVAQEGDTLGWKPLDKSRLIAQGDEIDLNEAEIRRMITHIMSFLVPQLLRDDFEPIHPTITVSMNAYDQNGRPQPPK